MGVIAVSRRVQTLLFTDIVGSTDRLRELGDAAWAALLVRHHEVVRAVLAGHGGREVDTAGDGLLARFDAPAPALRAAAAAVAAVAALGIEIRAGLHTGEVELHGDVMTGVGVHLAARVMAEAGPGQVLVSATIRELMAGSGLGFVDLGVHKLKGFPERWRLYALDPATVQGGEAELAAYEPAVGIEAAPRFRFRGSC
jgi:class 3 adenylate cyclase